MSRTKSLRWRLAFDPLTLDPTASIPLSCLVTFVISMPVSFMLNGIPVAKKHNVGLQG